MSSTLKAEEKQGNVIVGKANGKTDGRQLMTKAIFTTRVDSRYDDLPEVRYHFPRTYLRTAERAIDDWIVYYAPRRTPGNVGGGRQVYFAIARVTSIESDPDRKGHFYAFVSNYLPFTRPVPFKEDDYYYESGLRRKDGQTNKGAFGRSIRSVPDDEFERILQAGFSDLVIEDRESAQGLDTGLQDELFVSDRPVIHQVVARPFRDAAFRRQIKQAYDNTCAITGIQIINGGGRSEVQAAHIRPVKDQGPDSIRNGIALSGTFHWMFDRGLVSIADDHTILVAEDRIPSRILAMVNPDRRLCLPRPRALAPHPRFIRYHRETVFLG